MRISLKQYKNWYISKDDGVSGISISGDLNLEIFFKNNSFHLDYFMANYQSQNLHTNDIYEAIDKANLLVKL